MSVYKETKYLADRFNIRWPIKTLKEMIKEGQKMFGDYYLFYERQIAEFVKQVVPIIKEIIAKIVKQFTIDESEYWRNENYVLWKYLSSQEFERQIEELNSFGT